MSGTAFPPLSSCGTHRQILLNANLIPNMFPTPMTRPISNPIAVPRIPPLPPDTPTAIGAAKQMNIRNSQGGTPVASATNVLAGAMGSLLNLLDPH